MPEPFFKITVEFHDAPIEGEGHGQGSFGYLVGIAMGVEDPDTAPMEGGGRKVVDAGDGQKQGLEGGGSLEEARWQAIGDNRVESSYLRLCPFRIEYELMTGFLSGESLEPAGPDTSMGNIGSNAHVLPLTAIADYLEKKGPGDCPRRSLRTMAFFTRVVPSLFRS